MNHPQKTSHNSLKKSIQAPAAHNKNETPIPETTLPTVAAHLRGDALPRALLSLQRTHGNAYVQRLIRQRSSPYVARGNKSGKTASSSDEKEGGIDNSKFKTDTSEQDKLIRSTIATAIEEVSGELKREPPAAFEIMGAGSYARQELTAASDYDLFYVLPDSDLREKDDEVFLHAVLTRVKAKLAGALEIEIESPGTPASIASSDSKGGTMRTFKSIYQHKSDSLAGELTVALQSSERLIKNAAASMLATISTTLKMDKKAELDVKQNLYRPLQYFVNIVALRAGLKSLNSLDRIDEMGSLLADAGFLGRLKAAFARVLELRSSGVSSIRSSEALLIKNVLREIQQRTEKGLKLENLIGS